MNFSLIFISREISKEKKQAYDKEKEEEKKYL